MQVLIELQQKIFTNSQPWITGFCKYGASMAYILP